jgi:hypothetical protein
MSNEPEAPGSQQVCPQCKGTGNISLRVAGILDTLTPCPFCHGEGRVPLPTGGEPPEYLDPAYGGKEQDERNRLQCCTDAAGGPCDYDHTCLNHKLLAEVQARRRSKSAPVQGEGEI